MSGQPCRQPIVISPAQSYTVALADPGQRVPVNQCRCHQSPACVVRATRLPHTLHSCLTLSLLILGASHRAIGVDLFFAQAHVARARFFSGALFLEDRASPHVTPADLARGRALVAA